MFRLRGKGFPRAAGARGDAHVRVVVETPAAVSDEAKALLEKLGAALTDDALPRRRAFREAGQRAKPEAPMSRGRRRRRRPARGAGPAQAAALLHAGLFLATFLTTTMTGAIQVHGGLSIGPMNDGLIYSVPLMLILLCHELGPLHRGAAPRRRRVAAVLHPVSARAARDAGRRDRDAPVRRPIARS